MARLSDRFLLKLESPTNTGGSNQDGVKLLSEPRVLKSLGLVREDSMPI
jgi:hypothetical protein